VETGISNNQRIYKLFIGAVSIAVEIYIFILERSDITVKLFFRKFYRIIPLGDILSLLFIGIFPAFIYLDVL
jgi:hypothetical protein